MSTQADPVGTTSAALSAWGERYFTIQHTSDPLNATLLGITDFDDLLGDVSPAGSATTAAELAALSAEIAAADRTGLDESATVDIEVLAWLVNSAHSDAEHCLWEAGASAAGYVSPQALVFQAVPATPIVDRAAAERWRTRLAGLPDYFDALLARYRDAVDRGRTSPRCSLLQAIDQLDGHLARPPAEDVLLSVALPADAADLAEGALADVTERIRPAMSRLSDGLRDLLAVARDDEHVGIGAVPGGAQGYAAAVARHTSTTLTPEQIHQIGLDVLADLQQEWAVLGERVLGERRVPEILERLRSDPTLRFDTAPEVLGVVTRAMNRAEAAVPDWFAGIGTLPCVVEEIDPVEAGNAALAYYRPASLEGNRPGAHCVLTADPGNRFRYEYEALAFHESVPGHHLQISSALLLPDLPRYRKHLDAQLCAYIEGWGLYSERLADEMGLYTDDLARLGMLSFDALRACRLVVDTGMHALGWSRSRAIEFLWSNTATTRANVTNEIDRYIAWPGQALAYMIGRREIGRLRERSSAVLGASFDIRDFHRVVLSQGAVPHAVLEGIIDRWATGATGATDAAPA